MGQARTSSRRRASHVTRNHLSKCVSKRLMDPTFCAFTHTHGRRCAFRFAVLVGNGKEQDNYVWNRFANHGIGHLSLGDQQGSGRNHDVASPKTDEARIACRVGQPAAAIRTASLTVLPAETDKVRAGFLLSLMPPFHPPATQAGAMQPASKNGYFAHFTNCLRLHHQHPKGAKRKEPQIPLPLGVHAAHFVIPLLDCD